MRLSGLLELTGKTWASELKRLDRKIGGVRVKVDEEKMCVPGSEPGTYAELTESYNVRFVSAPTYKNGLREGSYPLAFIHLARDKHYSDLDIDFQMHWEPQKSNILKAIYSHYDARIDKPIFRFKKL